MGQILRELNAYYLTTMVDSDRNKRSSVLSVMKTKCARRDTMTLKECVEDLTFDANFYKNNDVWTPVYAELVALIEPLDQPAPFSGAKVLETWAKLDRILFNAAFGFTNKNGGLKEERCNRKYHLRRITELPGVSTAWNDVLVGVATRDGWAYDVQKFLNKKKVLPEDVTDYKEFKIKDPNATSTKGAIRGVYHKLKDSDEYLLYYTEEHYAKDTFDRVVEGTKLFSPFAPQ